jgi:hypothetical protein
MEASFESVCNSVSWKANRKLAYGLLKNKKLLFTGPTALVLEGLDIKLEERIQSV